MMEMDKSRDVRRRFVKQSKHKQQLLSGDFSTLPFIYIFLVCFWISWSKIFFTFSGFYWTKQYPILGGRTCRFPLYSYSNDFTIRAEFHTQCMLSLEKTKKERIKRLSAVNSSNKNNRAATASSCCCPEENCEMGGGGVDVSDREDEDLLPSTSKRFKFPSKFFDDRNGVDHASVPRKLRSAMKKRNCESISLPFSEPKKLNFTAGGMELCKRDGVKKSKLNAKQGGSDWCQKHNFCGPITKDEEEVAETLYSLAGMFSNHLVDSEHKSECASLDASYSLPEARKCVKDSVAVQEDLNSVYPSSTDEFAASASNMERLPEGTAIFDSNSTVQELSDFLGSSKVNGEFNLSISQLDLQTKLAKHETQKPSVNPVGFCIQNEDYQDPGKLKQPMKIEMSLLDRKPEIALGLDTEVGSQIDQPPHESMKNGRALWPGLPSTASDDACIHGSSSRIPAWLDSALCGTKTASSRSGSLTGKGSKVNAGRMSWKRCAAHICISHLIQALEKPESKDRQLHPSQLGPHDILKRGVLMTINDFNGVRNGLNGIASTSSLISTVEKSTNEAGNSILPYQRFDQGQVPQVSAASGGFNFLPLPAGGRGMESNSSFSGTVTELEPSSKLQVSYLQSHVQHPKILPSSISQTPYPSYYPAQPSATVVQQAQLQSPPYFGSPFYGSTTTSSALILQKQKQNQQQRQLQQHQLWAAQLAAQYRSAETSATSIHIPSWQNDRRDSPAPVSCAPSSVPSSALSLGVFYPKYSQISQQQQLMSITSSLPHDRVKKQEQTGGGFLAGSAMPLQLLCNERL